MFSQSCYFPSEYLNYACGYVCVRTYLSFVYSYKSLLRSSHVNRITFARHEYSAPRVEKVETLASPRYFIIYGCNTQATEKATTSLCARSWFVDFAVGSRRFFHRAVFFLPEPLDLYDAHRRL